MKNKTDIELIKFYQDSNDNRAMEELLSRYEDYLHKQAHKHNKNVAVISHDDLYQEAVIGFIKGVKNFDITADNGLMAYVGSYVFSEIINFLDYNIQSVRIGTRKSIRKIRNHYQEYNRGHYQKSLTDKEISKMSKDLNVSIKDIRYTERGIKTTSAPIYNSHYPSVDFSDNDREYLIDKNVMSPEEIFLKKEQTETVQRTVSKLKKEMCGYNERMEDILQTRILADKVEVTLSDLSKKYGISMERVRQIEARIRKVFSEHKEEFVCVW